jgi:hypothetical protein
MTANRGAVPATASVAGRGRTVRARAGSALWAEVGVILLCASAIVCAVEICRRAHVLTEAPPDAVTLRRVVFGIY